MKSILVVATRQIGDVLLTSALIHAARERWPAAGIDVIGFAGTLGMLKGNPDVRELIETPPRLGGGGFLRLVNRLWRRYDLALITQPGDRAHLIGCLAAPKRSGIVPEEGGSNWWKKRLLDHVVVSGGDRGTQHVVAEKLSLLAPWMDGKTVAARVIPPPPSTLPGDVQGKLRPGAVVLHVPSMWRYKQWPLPHYRTVAAALLARGRQVVLTGSAGANDQACVGALRDLASSPDLLDVSGRLDFNQLTTLLQFASLYIGPDTSVSHLAAAAGIPVVAVFGPTNPMRWAPWPAKPTTQALFERSTAVQTQGNVTVLQSGLSCVPCGRAGCEDHVDSRSDCLHDIGPERVLREAWRLLDEAPPAPVELLAAG
jgi:heptosyltransferase-3